MLFSMEGRSQGAGRVPHPRISQLTAGAGANDAKPSRQCRNGTSASHVLRDAVGLTFLDERETRALLFQPNWIITQMIKAPLGLI